MKYTKRIALGLLLLTVLFVVTGCSPLPFAWPGLAADDKAVYVTLLDGKIHALDLDNGTEIWTFPPEPERKSGLGCTGPAQTATGLYANPLLAQETVFAGGYGGQVYALDKTGGTQRWSFENQEEAQEGTLASFFSVRENPAIIGSLTLDGDTLYIPSAGGSLYAIDATSGVKRWDFHAAQSIWTSPLVTKERIYVAAMDHKLYCLDKENRTGLWSFDAEGAIPSTPALDKDTIYLGSLARKVFAIDADTGAQRWTFETGSWAWARPLIVSDTVYVSEIDGTLYALDAKTGAKRWDFLTQGKIQGTPAYTNGSLYLPSEDKNLHVLDAATGAQKWKFTASAALMSTPVPVNDTLYVVDMDNKVYALNAESGTQKWVYDPTPEK